MECSKWEFYYDFVVPLIKEAGSLIIEAKDYETECKELAWDLVTKYDYKVEETLIKKIKEKFPDHKFIGEEESSTSKIQPQLTDAPTWIIDPIDGTANFVRKMPITCISVGLVVNKEQVIGIVYNPFLNELYSAIKGRGAYLNSKRIFCSGVEDITKSVLNYELSLARLDSLRDLYMYRLKHLMCIIQGIRSYGCAALGLCYVARGATDAYQCDGLYPWDVAAGSLIVREAGGFVCSSNGEDFDLMNPNFIAAATKKLAEEYVAVEKRADEERRLKECAKSL